MRCKQESNDEGNESPGSDDKLAELESEVALRSSKGRKMRTGPSKKKTKKADKGEPKKGKKMTKWEDTKLSKKEIEELDRSKEVRARATFRFD